MINKIKTHATHNMSKTTSVICFLLLVVRFIINYRYIHNITYQTYCFLVINGWINAKT